MSDTNLTWRDLTGNVDVEREEAAYDAMAALGAAPAAMPNDAATDDLPY